MKITASLGALALGASLVASAFATPAFAAEGYVGIAMPTKSSARWIDDGNGVLIEEGTPDLRITAMDGRVFNVDVPADATCIQDVLDAVASAVDATGAANDGAVLARVHADGLRLEVVDQTGGSGVLRIESTGGNPHAAGDLGLEGNGVDGIVVGDRLLAGLDSVLISNLNGGNGLPPEAQMRFRYAANETTNFSIGPGIESVGQLIADLNRQAVENDHTFRFELNDAANGIRVIADDSSNLNFAGELAESLGLLGLGVGVKTPRPVSMESSTARLLLQCVAAVITIVVLRTHFAPRHRAGPAAASSACALLERKEGSRARPSPTGTTAHDVLSTSTGPRLRPIPRVDPHILIRTRS